MEPGTRTTYTTAHQLSAQDIRPGDMVHLKTGWTVVDIVAVRDEQVILQHGESSTTLAPEASVTLRMADND